MSRIISIGRQDYEKLRLKNNFYIDKTHFIKEWWEADDEVTLIARPRRFGKTLNMSMLEKFFSSDYAGRSELFEGLSIWKDKAFRKIQGTYPVISLSFANIKETDYEKTRRKICEIIASQYAKRTFLLEGNLLSESEKETFHRKTIDMDDVDATLALHQLSDYLSRYYGKNVIILLDEYDTPMQEAYVGGYWSELTTFIRSMFNAAFKTNPYLERAIMTGITRISGESIFSDLNNLEVVTTTSSEYADSFGFTEGEVFSALDEYGLADQKGEVKAWYDGFTFGDKTDIYNPWSIVNYLNKKKVGRYWANSSANGLVGKLIREGSGAIKKDFEQLLSGGTITAAIDEQIVYAALDTNESAIWSLLLASGYLKVIHRQDYGEREDDWSEPAYELALTNLETRRMFYAMVRDWFQQSHANYNDFIKALLLGDLKAMNTYMNKVALTTFSYFDTGNRPSGAEPERFYHGFVLGLIVELSGKYMITSNRESGFGRYDVILEPKTQDSSAMILEFKVRDSEDEKTLEETAKAGLFQIKEKQYAKGLEAKGIAKERIREYGFAFEGKQVLICSSDDKV